jgi:hypothetical protein
MKTDDRRFSDEKPSIVGFPRGSSVFLANTANRRKIFHLRSNCALPNFCRLLPCFSHICARRFYVVHTCGAAEKLSRRKQNLCSRREITSAPPLFFLYLCACDGFMPSISQFLYARFRKMMRVWKSQVFSAPPLFSDDFMTRPEVSSLQQGKVTPIVCVSIISTRSRRTI